MTESNAGAAGDTKNPALAGDPRENPDPDTPPPLSQRIGPARLFAAFALLSLMGFGGVLPFAHRMLVEKRRWISNARFAELFALAQVLPGPPILHIAQMVGHRDSGWRGGFASVLGIVLLPTLLMMLMGLVYQHYGDVPLFRQTLNGMSAAAASLIVATGWKVSAALPRRARSWVLLALAFACLGLLRLPFLAVIATLAPLAAWLAWKGAEEKS